MTDLTCRDLEPLLRDTFTNAEAAFRALEDARGTWGRPVGSLARRIDRAAAEDLVQLALVKTVDRAQHHGGLVRPPDCVGRDPGAWLVTCLQRHIRDWRRRQQKREELTEIRPSEDVDPGPSAEDQVAARAAHRQLLARMQAVSGPPTRLLAALCLYAPDALDREHVDAAGAWRAGGAEGLARGVEETWTLLQAWRADHLDDTTSHVARRDLAWILRSQHPGPADRWEQDHPVDASRARDLVRQWATRLLAVVRQQGESP